MASSTELMPHSERDGFDGSVPYPHHVGETLVSELNTLCRLRDFYEQHTFDTQGPYADLFTLLLTSCKHVIDINVELVHHIKAQQDQQLRQQVACDVLCREAALQRADIHHLRASLAHLSARGANGEAPMVKCEDDGAGLGSGSAASSHASPKNETATPECCQHVSQRSPAASLAPQRSTGAAAPSSAAAGLERSSLSTTLASLVGPVSQAHATVTFAPTEAPEQPINSLTRSPPFDHACGGAWAAGMKCRTDAMQGRSATVLVDGQLSSARLDEVQQKQQQSSTALSAPSDARKHHAEDAVESRLEHLTRHLAVMDQRVHKQRRMWEEEDVGSRSPSASPVAAPGMAGESEFPHPCTTVVGHARSNPQKSIQRQETSVTSPVGTWTPPAVLVRWLDSRLRRWEGEWKRVLEDVQDALLLDATVDAETLRPIAHAAGQQEAHVNLETAQERASESNEGAEAVMTPSCRGDLVCAIRVLLSCHGTELYKRIVAECNRQVQRTDEELHDLRSRLEALEVYAPHRYAVTARPPLLGVELEDVLEPRIGVRLRTVYHGYLADRAGLNVGDVLVGVGHQSIQTRAQLYVVLGELTRDYSAQCHIQIEAGFMRGFALGDGHCVECNSPHREATVDRNGNDYGLDQELQRARSEAAAAAAGGTIPSDAHSPARWLYRHSSLKGRAAMAGSSAAASPFLSTFHSAAQHKEKLAQYLPYFELCLHVVRDGRLRDVTLLIPPWEALRSAAY
ncbi:conserved hypothetical protein [Leishmania major strain Friedlin]|uniref:PDZ domain-containing protein n=1 Tax=Leishmania major TaxID=5664 RepID=Q4QD73_LEIMA|nr:conserved hypothetical protein [Leishmania major strain Friedlin]CAG9572847.1 hypothetical_protein_-_conserved [Leishmania major strain Friedlin]CAJ07233.1 conserved hypothetical protein [Leishmania major strain Friedlin]|eukprot:XP_001682725.1 conserved hypothetical protein [Leishmania major strain Friedlin]